MPPCKTLPEYVDQVLHFARKFASCAPASDVDGPWFRGVNDKELGLVPGAYWRPHVDEYALTIDFIDEAPPYFDGGGLGRHYLPDTLWDWYFLMQHYGMPTRLLDWTENALVGLFFSLYVSGPKPCVWVLDPAQFNRLTTGAACVISPGGDYSKQWLPIAAEDQPFGCKLSSVVKFEYHGKSHTNEKPLAIYAARRNARIIAQQGTFTVHGSAAGSIHRMVPLLGQSPLARIDIAVTSRQSLLSELELCGVSESRLFPELERLAPRIKRRHQVTP